MEFYIAIVLWGVATGVMGYNAGENDTIKKCYDKEIVCHHEEK